MELKLLIPSVGVALTIVLAAIGVLLIMREQGQRKIRDRLHDVVIAGEHEGADATNVIVRDMDLSTVPLLNSMLQNAGWAWKLDKLLVQADVAMRLGTFLLLMMVLTAFGIAFCVVVLHNVLVALPAGILMGSIPLIWVNQKKKKRVLKFERQFPDAPRYADQRAARRYGSQRRHPGRRGRVRPTRWPRSSRFSSRRTGSVSI